MVLQSIPIVVACQEHLTYDRQPGDFSELSFKGQLKPFLMKLFIKDLILSLIFFLCLVLCIFI